VGGSDGRDHAAYSRDTGSSGGSVLHSVPSVCYIGKTSCSSIMKI
jgi:hypothetical protein